MTHKDYLIYLLEMKHHPTSFSYGITNRMGKDENGKLKSFDDEEMIYFEIGFMHHLPIKLEIINVYSRSAELSFVLFKKAYKIHVYCHLDVSPREFHNRVENALWKELTKIKDGDDEWPNFKEAHDEGKKNIFGNLFKGMKEGRGKLSINGNEVDMGEKINLKELLETKKKK